MLKNKVMQRTGLSDTELASPGVGVGSVVIGVVAVVVGVVAVSVVVVVVINGTSHELISESYFSTQARFSLAVSTALFAASVAAPRSLLSMKFSNCQERKNKKKLL
jgi:hypothetical protein